MAKTIKPARRRKATHRARTTGVRGASSPGEPALTPLRGKTAPQVRIRMYRQPFGDAFLLTFDCLGESRHILIDCGVLHGVPQGRQWSQDIVRDVANATSGHLDVIVATHMHWDHVSGFSDASAAFGGFRVDEVWLPWPENPADTLAATYQRFRRTQLEALRRTRLLLQNSHDARSLTLMAAETQLDKTLGFYGPQVNGVEALETARNTLLRLWERPRFLERGMRIEPLRLPYLRAYVLGPARDDALLGFKGHGCDRGFYGALIARADTRENREAEIEVMQPFDLRQRWTTEWRRENPLVRALIESYDAADQTWRRIDDEWLSQSVEIAGRLQAASNNSSLALAFELADSGNVLLFPGDARIGGLQTFESSSDEVASAPVTTADLLARTVFYKVPDHGAQTAMIIDSLRSMTHPDLVAALTADREFARAAGLEVPADAIHARLLEKTHGRLLVPQPHALAATAAQPSSSNRSFLDRVAVTALYVDLFIQ